MVVTIHSPPMAIINETNGAFTRRREFSLVSIWGGGSVLLRKPPNLHARTNSTLWLINETS